MASRYSIKELEQLSGIKAHTIRMWEQRYGILKAARTVTNIRYYDDTDLKYIMSLALLNKKGYRISKLAALSQQEISNLVGQLASTVTEFEAQIEGLVIATLDYDEERFEKIINTSILQIGFEDTIKRIVFPFLDKVGVMWVSGAMLAAQEHFMSQLLRQKIIVAIDGHVKRYDEHSKKIILFLPNGEWHELTLLFLNYLLKSRNHRVTYLGASVPLKEVITVAHTIQPDYFYTIITSIPAGYSVDEYLNTLSDSFPTSKIFASGNQFINTHHNLNDNVLVINGIDHVLAKVDEISARVA